MSGTISETAHKQKMNDKTIPMQFVHYESLAINLIADSRIVARDCGFGRALKASDDFFATPGSPAGGGASVVVNKS
jgi:hypothetical protein